MHIWHQIISLHADSTAKRLEACLHLKRGAVHTSSMLVYAKTETCVLSLHERPAGQAKKVRSHHTTSEDQAIAPQVKVVPHLQRSCVHGRIDQVGTAAPKSPDVRLGPRGVGHGHLHMQ